MLRNAPPPKTRIVFLKGAVDRLRIPLHAEGVLVERMAYRIEQGSDLFLVRFRGKDYRARRDEITTREDWLRRR